MIRCGRVQQSRQHQSLGQRGGGQGAKWPDRGAQHPGNDASIPSFLKIL